MCFLNSIDRSRRKLLCHQQTENERERERKKIRKQTLEIARIRFCFNWKRLFNLFINEKCIDIFFLLTFGEFKFEFEPSFDIFPNLNDCCVARNRVFILFVSVFDVVVVVFDSKGSDAFSFAQMRFNLIEALRDLERKEERKKIKTNIKCPNSNNDKRRPSFLLFNPFHLMH